MAKETKKKGGDTPQQEPDVALARGAQQAAIVAEVAHAGQAMSVAQKRGGRAA